MCFTKNQAPTDSIFQSTPYIETFKSVFLENRDEFPILKNLGSGTRYKNSLLIDANQVMDLKNGMRWNQTRRATFKLAIHPNYDMADMRDTGTNIVAGYKTTVRVNTIQLESNSAIKRLPLKKRNCKFDMEYDGLSIFQSYSRLYNLT